MVAVSVKTERIKSFFMIMLMLAILGGSALFLRHLKDSEKIMLPSESERLVFLEDNGYSPVKKDEVSTVIPIVWNEVYEDYNLLQKEQGLGLDDFRGKNAVRHIYSSGDKEITLLICDNQLIAADEYDYLSREQNRVLSMQQK